MDKKDLKVVSSKEAVERRNLLNKAWNYYKCFYKMHFNKTLKLTEQYKNEITNLVNRIGEDSLEIICFYFLFGWHEDKFIYNKFYPIPLLLAQLDKIQTAYNKHVQAGTFKKGECKNATYTQGGVVRPIIPEGER